MEGDYCKCVFGRNIAWRTGYCKCVFSKKHGMVIFIFYKGIHPIEIQNLTELEQVPKCVINTSPKYRLLSKTSFHFFPAGSLHCWWSKNDYSMIFSPENSFNTMLFRVYLMNLHFYAKKSIMITLSNYTVQSCVPPVIGIFQKWNDGVVAFRQWWPCEVYLYPSQQESSESMGLTYSWRVLQPHHHTHACFSYNNV